VLRGRATVSSAQDAHHFKFFGAIKRATDLNEMIHSLTNKPSGTKALRHAFSLAWDDKHVACAAIDDSVIE